MSPGTRLKSEQGEFRQRSASNALPVLDVLEADVDSDALQIASKYNLFLPRYFLKKTRAKIECFFVYKVFDMAGVLCLACLLAQVFLGFVGCVSPRGRGGNGVSTMFLIIIFNPFLSVASGDDSDAGKYNIERPSKMWSKWISQ